MYIESYRKQNKNILAYIIGGFLILVTFLHTSDKLNISDFDRLTPVTVITAQLSEIK